MGRHSRQSEESRRGDSLFDERFFATLRMTDERIQRDQVLAYGTSCWLHIRQTGCLLMLRARRYPGTTGWPRDRVTWVDQTHRPIR
jgi:hypothetical protein